MSRRPWLPRLLFRLAWAQSAALLALVLLAPMLDRGGAPGHGWRRALGLFARDAAVRRTAVAAGLGLLVTAHVFFRPPALPRPASSRRQPPRMPPTSVAGA
jgi:hypothetical protein